ncbi:MAG: recombinase family protein, partial [Acholeplasma sp.]|nr:recombinase family protein [Acholeplasma sp.]
MNNLIYGYARVSSKEQNEERQLKAIKDYCIKNDLIMEDRNILIDKQSGKDFKRPSYQTLKEQLLRKGDILVIKELDRLGRNKQQIKEELEDLKNKGVIIRILNIPTTLIEIPEGNQWVMEMVNNILIEVLGAIAEEERATTRQRQKEGIEIAKAKGKHLGRPKINYSTISKNQRELIKENYSKWKAKEITAVKFMEILDFKTNTFYKIMKEYEEYIAE